MGTPGAFNTFNELTENASRLGIAGKLHTKLSDSGLELSKVPFGKLASSMIPSKKLWDDGGQNTTARSLLTAGTLMGIPGLSANPAAMGAAGASAVYKIGWDKLADALTSGDEKKKAIAKMLMEAIQSGAGVKAPRSGVYGEDN